MASYTGGVFDGAGLRKQREALGLSLDELSELAQVNRITINRIELGKVKKPRLGTLRKLVKALSQGKEHPHEEFSFFRRTFREPPTTAREDIEKPKDSLLGDIRAARESLTRAVQLLEDALRRAGG